MDRYHYPFKSNPNNDFRPMNVLEQRFMETMPSILRDLTEEVKKLRKEVAEINEKLKDKESGQQPV